MMWDWENDLEQWLAQNDLTIDLTAVWCLFIGFAIVCFVKVVSFAVLWHQHDRTPVGRTLKWEKLGEAMISAALSSLYGLTLYAYYQEHAFGVYPQTLLRSLIVVGIIAAAVWGLRFVDALRRENWGRASVTERQNARDVQQDQREVEQDARDVEHMRGGDA